MWLWLMNMKPEGIATFVPETYKLRVDDKLVSRISLLPSLLSKDNSRAP